MGGVPTPVEPKTENGEEPERTPNGDINLPPGETVEFSDPEDKPFTPMDTEIDSPEGVVVVVKFPDGTEKPVDPVRSVTKLKDIFYSKGFKENYSISFLFAMNS